MTSEPLILAFDTSVAHCAAALLWGDQVLVQRDEPMAKGQAERLFPLLEEVLAEAGKTWGDLTAIGVGTGPGNFTGIRISVAAARGLALSLGIPAVGVSGFEALALGHPRPVLSLLSARRNHVFAQEITAKGMGEPFTAKADSLPDMPAIGPAETISAEAIARIAARRYSEQNLPRPAPLYVRAPDAAPPRDPAPVILP